jgi:transposase-like protein
MPRLVPIEERSKAGTSIVLWCARGYLRYQLSYRDLVAMMGERGMAVAHTTILRWVQHDTADFEKRGNRYA